MRDPLDLERLLQSRTMGYACVAHCTVQYSYTMDEASGPPGGRMIRLTKFRARAGFARDSSNPDA